VESKKTLTRRAHSSSIARVEFFGIGVCRVCRGVEIRSTGYCVNSFCWILRYAAVMIRGGYGGLEVQKVVANEILLKDADKDKAN
jgi:hypothetical protein